jgi:hypothetical protein
LLNQERLNNQKKFDKGDLISEIASQSALSRQMINGIRRKKIFRKLRASQEMEDDRSDTYSTTYKTSFEMQK